MVRNAFRTLKIGVHSPFDQNFDVRNGIIYLENFGRPIVQQSVVHCCTCTLYKAFSGRGEGDFVKLFMLDSYSIEYQE